MKNVRNTLVTKSSKSLIKTETHEVTIMKMLNKKPPGLHKKAIGVAAGIFLSALLMPGSASATTAANAVITNTATVNYDDSAGNIQAAIQASASVTVNLVTAAPTLTAPADQSTPSTVAIDYTYTITNNSNGLDAYALSTATSAVGANITVGTILFRNSGDTADITSVNLGATSASATAAIGANTITVPNDGTADSELGGLVAGDTVIIGGNAYVVSAITDTGAGTETLTLTTNLTTNVSVGDLIAEQTTFILRATAVTTVSGETYTITTTATDGANPTTDDVITTVTLINLTVTKYVANITAAVVGGGSTITVNTGLGAGSITYYSTGVTGNPGNVLEYVIGIANAATSATATDVVISDPVPNFTAQTGNIALDPGTGTWSDVATTADNGDFAEVVGATVFIYAGTGGNDTVGGGSLAISTTTLGAFRVTITP